MFLYIDALFRPNSNYKLKTDYLLGNNGFITTDSAGVRNIPPYMLDPIAIMVVTSNGGMEVFDNDAIGNVLTRFGEHIECNQLTKDSPCVGWYIDQVVIPVICASSVIHHVKSVTRWMRRLDDKWSKTMACSLERAFTQGWYPSDRSESYDSMLTLDEAVKMCGLKDSGIPVDDLVGSSNIMAQELTERIIKINKLHALYQESSMR